MKGTGPTLNEHHLSSIALGYASPASFATGHEHDLDKSTGIPFCDFVTTVSACYNAICLALQ